MRHLALILEYDGTDFAGFQVQTAQRTVQGELERALRTITGDEIRVKGAGRTDAGVHAIGQVVSLATTSRLPIDTLVRALNATLARDVAVKTALETPESFHARYSARARVYRYRVWNASTPTPIGRRYSHHWRGRLDLSAVAEAARTLVGTHDFASFGGSSDPTSDESVSTVRNVRRLEVRGDGSLVEITIEANAFLPQMVRTIVGTLLLVGGGKLPVERVGEILLARSRAAAGPTAPPEGLCLVAVRYSPAALGRAGDAEVELIEGPGERLPFAEADIESQWRLVETPDDARSIR